MVESRERKMVREAGCQQVVDVLVEVAEIAMRDLVEVGDVLLEDRPVVSRFRDRRPRAVLSRRVHAQCGSGTARLGLKG